VLIRPALYALLALSGCATADPPPTATHAAPTLRRIPGHDAGACGQSIKYPAVDIAARREGDVKLRLRVAADGRVTEAWVQSGVSPSLDAAALDAIRHSSACVFTPAIAADGRAVAIMIPYTFHFVIPHAP
jgi:TonB family protein